MKPIINILWTGGLDSTFRLVELSRENVEIQPFYIVDPIRKSIPQEKKAMDRIYILIKNKPQTKATLRDIRFIELNTIESNNEITNSWKRFSDSHKLGSQYDFIARFALQNKLILEVGLENSDRSKAATTLKQYGNLQQDHYIDNSNEWEQIYKISDDCSSKECKNVFERLRFPKHLFSIEKVEEIELLKKWGCEDIMRNTWFCHRPVFGLPCGRCNPCKDALNEGLSWRVPMTGRILGTVRYYIYGGLRRVARVIKK